MTILHQHEARRSRRMGRSATGAAFWSGLGAGIAGEVLLPGPLAYESARRPVEPRYHHIRPLAVVSCAAPADVAQTLVFTRRHGLPVAVRSGGHDFAGRSSTTGVLLDLSPMRSVRVDGDTVQVGAGARLGELEGTLLAQGRVLPAGCGPTVGIAGLTLGGGIGVLGRAYGLTCDQLLAADVAVADGRILTCDAHRHPDLFWALRGGGAIGIAAVTGLGFTTQPAPTMNSFRLTWPAAQADQVVLAWQEWAPTAPTSVAASLHLTADAQAGHPVSVTVSGTVAGAEVDARAQLERLVAWVRSDPDTAEQRHGTLAQAKSTLPRSTRPTYAATSVAGPRSSRTACRPQLSPSYPGT